MKELLNVVLNSQVGKHMNVKFKKRKRIEEHNSMVLETIKTKNGQKKGFRWPN